MRIRTASILVVILTLVALGPPLSVAAQSPVSCEVEYTVQADDWLSKIAEKYLGDVLAYDQIVTATSRQTDDAYATIEDPNLIEPGWLICIPAAGGESARAAAGPELVGPIWLWDQTPMNNGDTFVPDNPNNYSIQFRPDGTVSIQADCNSVGGTYTVDGSSITIQTGPTTLVACPPGSLGDQFVTQLNGAAIYFIQGENLFIDLKFDSGTMQFTAQSSELAGSSWVVNGYNNGQEAVVSVIIGTEMTATFGEDGMLSGSAGCNTYNATYEVSGENISIGPAATTRKLCSEPEGIMEQEQQYLAALETAATYSIRGERLELRTATGALAASFNRARDVAGAIRGALEELQAQPERTQVWVDSVEIQMVDGEYVATIIGNYPDSCSTLGEVETTVEGDTVTVTVFAESPPDMMCASVLTPFEESITIDVSELEPGEYSVVVNETATTTLTIN